MEVDLTLQQELIKAVAAFTAKKNWYDSAAAIALVSGIVAILGSMISHLFNICSEKTRRKGEIELKKAESEIRKKENIQKLQIEALKEFSIINNDIQPTVWSHPDYEEYDAYFKVVISMELLLIKEYRNFHFTLRYLHVW